MPLGERSRQQLSLPLRHGGLGLTSVVDFLAIAYASSLIDTADVRASWMPATEVSTLVAKIAPPIDDIAPSLALIPDLQSCAAAALHQHPQPTQRLLSLGLNVRKAAEFWRDEEWQAAKTSPPSGSPRRPKVSTDLVLLRGRYNALHTPQAVPFLTAGYHATGFIGSPLWSVAMRRYLGTFVYDGSGDDLRCSFCASRVRIAVLDRLGHHTLRCSVGYGAAARHSALVYAFISNVLRPSGHASAREVQVLVPNTTKRPTIVLVQPLAVAPGRRRVVSWLSMSLLLALLFDLVERTWMRPVRRVRLVARPRPLRLGNGICY